MLALWRWRRLTMRAFWRCVGGRAGFGWRRSAWRGVAGWRRLLLLAAAYFFRFFVLQSGVRLSSVGAALALLSLACVCVAASLAVAGRRGGGRQYVVC